MTPTTITHSPIELYNVEGEIRKPHSKMLNDDTYHKRDYIVQLRIHRSDDNNIQARKDYALLKLIPTDTRLQR